MRRLSGSRCALGLAQVEMVPLVLRDLWGSTTLMPWVLAGVSLTSPDGFDLDVGTMERVDAIHAAAVGTAVVMGTPQDFPDQGVRCFLLIDPNGVAINVAARLGQGRST